MTDAEMEQAICRRSGHEFVAVPKRYFAGLQALVCPDCQRAVVYPLTRGFRIWWWFIAILASASGVWANITLNERYSWIPGGVGLLSFVILCIDVGVRRRVDLAVRNTRAVTHGDETHHGAPIAGGFARPVAASPSYVAALTVVITLSMLSSVLGALAVAGLNNAYSSTVVLQDARAATTQPGYGSSIDLAQSSEQLCGDGDDYNGCLNMHVAMYNSVCVGTTLEVFAKSRCSSLLDFIEGVRAQSDNCGAGCTTRAGDDGILGVGLLASLSSSSGYFK